MALTPDEARRASAVLNRRLAANPDVQAATEVFRAALPSIDEDLDHFIAGFRVFLTDLPDTDPALAYGIFYDKAIKGMPRQVSSGLLLAAVIRLGTDPLPAVSDGE